MSKQTSSAKSADNQNNFIRKRWPELLVLLICVVVLAVGIGGKEGYHMDELLSFELSNARFTPWIVPTQPQGRLDKFVENEIDSESVGETVGNLVETVEDVLTNRGNSTMLSYVADVYEEPVWISEEEFKDYITVDTRDDFNYLSVYFNVKDDNHPPLHFMLLHTMSSLFKEEIYPYLGCVINVLTVFGVMVLLMKLGERLWPKQGRFVGILAAGLYGLSAGAMATTLLIRMYAMVTFFCVAFCYLHIKKWQENGFEQKNKLLILVTVLGFLTQYFFLFYCLFLALITAVALLLGKKYKPLLCYIRTMILSAVIGVGLFPFAILDVFSSGRGVEALNNLSEGLAGYGSRLASFWGILSERTFGALLLPLLVAAAVVLLVSKLRQKGENKNTVTGQTDKTVLAWMMIFPVVCYFLLVARMAPYLVDRYMMPAFPFVVFLVVFALIKGVYGLMNSDRDGGMKGSTRALVLGGISLFLIIWQFAGICRYDGEYQYKGYEAQVKLAEEYTDYPCICVYEGVGYYENLIEFTSYENTLLVKTGELAERKDKESVKALDEVVVLVKYGAEFDAVQEIMEETYGFTMDKYLLQESVHGDKIALFVQK